jgi:uncharacterized protein YciI
MAFVILCNDKPNSLELRLATRPAHVAYIESFIDKLVLAGPLLAEDGETPQGSMIIMNFATRGEAEIFAAGDPYAKAGLFRDTTIRPFRKALPAA